MRYLESFENFNKVIPPVNHDGRFEMEQSQEQFFIDISTKTQAELDKENRLKKEQEERNKKDQVKPILFNK